jgi:hypothetical protein
MKKRKKIGPHKQHERVRLRIKNKKQKNSSKEPECEAQITRGYFYDKKRRTQLLLALSLDLPLVELEFFAFENIAIATSRLSGARRNRHKKATADELVSNCRIDAAILVPLEEGALQRGSDLARLFLLFGLAKSDAVMLVVPLTEGSSVDLNDGVLHKSVGADVVVVRAVVDDTQDTRLAGDG